MPLETESSAGRHGPALKQLVSATILYAALTVALSYPLAMSPSTLSRLDNGDARLNAWAISWVAHQLVRDPLALFDANTFYPLARTLAFSEHLTLQGAIALPLLAVSDDLVLTNNVILLLSMFASALGMYVLAYVVTGHHGASLLAGLFFSFSPFRFNRLPHLQMQLYGFLPLVLAGVHRYLATEEARYALFAAMAFVLQALAGTYLGAIEAVALAIALVTLLPFAGLSGRSLVIGAIPFAGAAAALVPFALPYLRVHRDLGVEWDLSGLGGLSATPASYLASSSHLYRGLTEAFIAPADRTDYLFFGLTLLGLGGVGLWLLCRERRSRPLALCYTAILVAGIVLSLGPRTPVYPFLYENVVFFRGLRALTRFALLPQLALSLLASVALARLGGLFEDARWRAVALTLIGAAFVAESTALPYPLAPHRDEPPEIYRWLRTREPGPFVELPFKVVDTRYMFWARHHDFRPTLNGDSGFVPLSHQWMKVALTRFPSADGIALLRQLEVRYVVLHLGAFRPRALTRLLTRLEDYDDALLPVRDFGGQVVYEVVPANGGAEIGGVAGSPLQARSPNARLFDGDLGKPVEGTTEGVLAIDIELMGPATVTGLRLHYGPVPRAPATRVEIVASDGASPSRPISSTPENWPAVSLLVRGLLQTPLDGTQTVALEPLRTNRFRVLLYGIDGTRPDLTELEVLGASAPNAQLLRVNTGNR